MPDVIVVGGGMAGLAAAWQLKAAGVRTRVLEAGEQPGGRVSTVHLRGAIVDTGAQFFGPPEPYVHTHAFLKHLDLLPSLQQASMMAALVRKGKVYPYRYGSAADFLKLPVISLSSKLRLLRVMPDLKRYQPLLDFHHLEKAASLDDEDLNHFVTNLAGREALDHLIQPLLGALYYYPRRGVSRAFLIAMVGSIGEIGTYGLAGGNQQLPERLASRLDVTCGARVREVSRQEGDKLQVVWEEGGTVREAAASAVVLAAPADVAAEIGQALSDEERTFLQSVRYTALVGVAFCTSRPFGGGVYGGAIAPDESTIIASVTFEQSKARDRVPEDQGLSLAFLEEERSREMLSVPDDEIVARAGAEMDRLWPGHRAATLWAYVFRHPRSMPLVEVGYLRRLEQFLARPSRTKGVALCGDYLCGPHVEGAITSGLRAAREITDAA